VETQLPAGTVTFLFTDIEGSTDLMRRLGDGYGEVLDDHRRLLREYLGKAGGREIDTQGDAFFFCFGRARDAVAAAVAGQRALARHEWPDGSELRVRMSLHTGEPVLGEEGYVGIDVHRAARICAAGHGGQVLLSATTAALVASGLPDGVGEVELGEVQLADLDVPERVYQLTIDGLPNEFPPLRTKQDEPLDLGVSIEQRVEQFVLQSIEQAFADSGPPGVGPPPRVPKTTKLAAWGALSLVILALAVIAVLVVLVLVVRALF
jgi:class 3 adenylate cyclase